MTVDNYVKIVYDLDKHAEKRFKELLREYDKSERELVDKVAGILLTNVDDAGNVVLTQSMLMEICNITQKVSSDFAETEKQFVNDVLESAYKQAYDETAKIIGIKANWQLLRKEFIDAAVNMPISGQNFSSRIWSNQQQLASDIQREIEDCIRNGTRPDEIIRRIRDKYSVTTYQAKRLVHTELARTVNLAQMDIYKNSGVVKKVMWTATLEGNTCSDCADLDGKKFDIDSAPSLPRHPSCRCCYVPIVEGYEPSQRADNTDKTKYIDYATYNEWAAQ